VSIAALEEIIYRGFYTNIGLSLHNWSAVAFFLILITCAFSMLHIRFGWVQVLAKTPLGMLALGITLISGNVFSAIVLHSVFNVSAWRAARVSISHGEAAKP